MGLSGEVTSFCLQLKILLLQKQHMHPNLQQVVQPGLVAEVEHQGQADQLSSLLVPQEELVGLLLLWSRKRLKYKI